jgi:hypothetical protein
MAHFEFGTVVYGSLASLESSLLLAYNKRLHHPRHSSRGPATSDYYELSERLCPA